LTKGKKVGLWGIGQYRNGPMVGMRERWDGKEDIIMQIEEMICFDVKPA
jgi:hypothetical protein